MRARPSPEPWDWGNGSLHMLAHDDISQDARSHKLCVSLCVSCQKQTCLQNRVAGMSCGVICRRWDRGKKQEWLEFLLLSDAVCADYFSFFSFVVCNTECSLGRAKERKELHFRSSSRE